MTLATVACYRRNWCGKSVDIPNNRHPSATPTIAAKRRGLERRHPARLSALGNRTSLEGTPRRVGGYLPTRLGVQFKLVRFYYALRRAGRPRSSPLPLRGELMWYSGAFRM
ncbi:MAG: hypothetical protein LBQ66_04615 [Planctomycetaceae bacterium]|nr:hypothetical protein [Planctomycetaceae bacterium]